MSKHVSKQSQFLGSVPEVASRRPRDLARWWLSITRCLACALIFSVGCGDDETAATDAGGDLPRELDLDEDITLDTEVEADVAADLPDDQAEDLTEDSDVPDLPPPDDMFEIVEGDTGRACGGDEPTCEGEFLCVENVCTLDPAGRAFVEQTYEFEEPEELAHVFEFIKTFADDVAFFMIEVSDKEGEPNRRPARYGTADRTVHADTLEVDYSWQFPEDIDRLLLHPVRGDSELEGDVWQSNQFQWNLRAHIQLEDIRVDEIIGFVGEQAQVYFDFEDDWSGVEGELRGVITRREAEQRELGSSAFEPFRTLVCQVHPDLVPPGQEWTLADILDCNAAPMDVDLNDDGILDGYYTRVHFLMEPVVLAEE